MLQEFITLEQTGQNIINGPLTGKNETSVSGKIEELSSGRNLKNYQKMIIERNIKTLQPSKQGEVNILNWKYDLIREFILETIIESGEVSYENLCRQAEKELGNIFEGKVLWYLLSVKLDLEAHHIIERVPWTDPHKLRLKKCSGSEI